MDGFDRAEHPTHSFVVRIWIEQAARPGRAATWRGHITHVQSGERRAVDSFVSTHRFVLAQLASAGLTLSLRDRIRMVFVKAARR